MRRVFVSFAVCVALSAAAEFTMDRSVMADAYWDAWNDDVQKRIDADIEAYRKADAAVEVSAPDGTEVQVEQVSHAFFFGAHIFNFNQLGTKARNDRYKALYGTLFNSATVAFYWRTFERYPYAPRFEERYEDTEAFWNACPNPKEQPHWRRPATDPVIAFLKTRGVRIHGHPLVWGNNAWMTPSWLWDDFCPEAEKIALQRAASVSIPSWDAIASPVGVKSGSWERAWTRAWQEVFAKFPEEEIVKLAPTFFKMQSAFYEKRIRDIAARYGSRVDSWDVVNESATDFARFGKKAVRGLPFDKSHYGPMPADYVFQAFTWAGKYLPQTAWFNLNDYNNNIEFVEQAKDLMANGARVDVVGSQMHLFNPKESAAIARGEFSKTAYALTHPAAVAERFARIAQAGRPIHLSEITITAPDNSPQGQMVQAIIMRNLYRAWFSVEKMTGITWWNVVDDCGAPGEPSISGLFTRDMEPKTAYFAMDDLINREWKTKLTVPAAEGKVTFRGFRGRYRLSWKDAAGKACSQFVTVE